MSVNPLTAGLAEYPMDKLSKIKAKLKEAGQAIYDFGTGDPTILVAPFIREALVRSLSDRSSYPSIYGLPELRAAQAAYLKRRFHVDAQGLMLLPATGSKESIFHVHLSLIGRAGGRKTIAYPDPGYPVYRSGTLFAGGTPYPVKLTKANEGLMQPWNFPVEVQKDLAAIWINYPHNPMALTCDLDYLKRLAAWCRDKDVMLLSDECYVDIYHPDFDAATDGVDRRPPSALQVGADKVISFFSLSKRSGLTGYRSGFMAGDQKFLSLHVKARSNFGVATSDIIQHAAIEAWAEESHVEKRREIFSQRMEIAGGCLRDLGLLDEVPKTTFYLWARIPARFDNDDEAFCLGLAERGVVTSPSSWLSEGVQGYFRMALVPDLPEMVVALDLIKAFVVDQPSA